MTEKTTEPHLPVTKTERKILPLISPLALARLRAEGEHLGGPLHLLFHYGHYGSRIFRKGLRGWQNPRSVGESAEGKGGDRRGAGLDAARMGRKGHAG